MPFRLGANPFFFYFVTLRRRITAIIITITRNHPNGVVRKKNTKRVSVSRFNPLLKNKKKKIMIIPLPMPPIGSAWRVHWRRLTYQCQKIKIRIPDALIEQWQSRTTFLRVKNDMKVLIRVSALLDNENIFTNIWAKIQSRTIIGKTFAWIPCTFRGQRHGYW